MENIRSSIKSSLEQKSKEELVDLLTDICMSSSAIKIAEANTVAQSLLYQRVDSSFTLCQQTINDLYKSVVCGQPQKLS